MSQPAPAFAPWPPAPVFLWRITLAVCLAIAYLLWPASAAAAKPCAAPWQQLPETGRQMLKPAPLIMVGLAAAAPAIMVPTDADHHLREFAQTDLGGSYNAEKVSLVAPYVLMPSIAVFWGSAWLGKWCHGQKTSAAMLQGVLLTAATYGTIKIVTGRRWPVWGDDPDELRLDDPERARDWAPFQRIDQELGAFPSGHTAFVFAAAAALRASSPELGWWRYSGYPFAAGMAFAMWFNDHHWMSDIVSGALLGEAIGGASGRAFSPLPTSYSEDISWMVLPTPGGGFATVSGQF